MEFATAGIILEVLNIYDHFKLALIHQPESSDFKDWLVGLESIKKEFEQFLQNFNIEEIKTEGQLFDPGLHEAVGGEASDQPEDKVIKEVRPGYKMGDKVLQPARVIVSQNKMT